MKPNSHGGARRGSGRKPKLDWKTCGFRLELDVIGRIQRTAKERAISQSELVNKLLKRTLPKT